MEYKILGITDDDFDIQINQSYNEMYSIISGGHVGCVLCMKNISEILKDMIAYFSGIEEYEKCQVIKEILFSLNRV